MLVYREARRSKKVTVVNPARDIRHRREDNSRVRYLNQFEPAKTKIRYLQNCTTEEERLTAVIAHQYPKHLEEFVFAVNTGLRKGSMYGLEWRMVDWKARMLNLPTSKNGEALHIPLNHAAYDALKAVYERGEEVGYVFQSEKTDKPLKNSRHWFDEAVEMAGIKERLVWHDLRHDFASKLRMKGARLEDIGELLGHKSLTMTKRYSHLGPNQLHKVAALLDNQLTPQLTPEPVSDKSNSVKYVQ